MPKAAHDKFVGDTVIRCYWMGTNFKKCKLMESRAETFILAIIHLAVGISLYIASMLARKIRWRRKKCRTSKTN